MGHRLHQNGIERPGLKTRLLPFLQHIKTASHEAFFPGICRSCGQLMSGAPILGLCDECSMLVIPCGREICMRCGGPLVADSSCVCNRFGIRHFDLARSSFIWTGPVRDIVLSLKYSKRWELAGDMAAVMAATWRESGLELPDMIIDVPLTPGRFLSRGYNQSALLAKSFAKTIGATNACSPLKRTSFQTSTKGSSPSERTDLVSGAFALKHPETVTGRSIIIIDDVITTGATLSECAFILKQGGARKVDVFSFARAVPHT